MSKVLNRKYEYTVRLALIVLLCQLHVFGLLYFFFILLYCFRTPFNFRYSVKQLFYLLCFMLSPVFPDFLGHVSQAQHLYFTLCCCVPFVFFASLKLFFGNILVLTLTHLFQFLSIHRSIYRNLSFFQFHNLEGMIHLL